MAGKIIDSLTVSVPVKQYQHGTVTEAAEEVIAEHRLSLHVNDHMLIQILCLSSHLKELIVGYLFTEGIIASYKDIDSLYVDEETGRAAVWLRQEEKNNTTEKRSNTEKSSKTENRRGECLPTTNSSDAVETPVIPRQNLLRPVEDAAYDCDIVLQHANQLLARSQLFRKTGNVHSVMLCRGRDMLCFMEDVGRFSAFDKCVGYAVMKEWALRDTCIYTTGRVPSSLVLKAVRAGIPMVVSRSAPTDAALDLAARYGVTVIGFARGEGMNIYK
jgi:FdhD protein